MTIWSDNATFSPSTSLTSTGSVNRQISASLSPGSVVTANSTSPQQFAAVVFSPAAGLAVTLGPKLLVLRAVLTPQCIASISSYSIVKSGSQGLAPACLVSSTFNQISRAKTNLVVEAKAVPSLSWFHIISNVASLSASTILPPVWPNIPIFSQTVLSVDVDLDADIFPVQFFAASLSVQTGISPNETIAVYEWIKYGSELLYAASSGLEKAIIDTDAPRITQINAEAIIDTWDPYNCPLPLLPYLAWAMGVTFWNDKWSEETKRTWVAAQWQFKALRGTDAGINMAVDFAGRDVSPFGYHVRDITTSPQGQYPSPGITHAAQEEWLASLPQVREYLFVEGGKASVNEFYMNATYLSP